MNQEVHVDVKKGSDTDDGRNDITLEEKGITIGHDMQSIHDNNADPEESHPAYIHESINQEAYSIVNTPVPEYADQNQARSSDASKLKKEAQPGQGVLFDVEQPVLANEKNSSLKRRRHLVDSLLKPGKWSFIEPQCTQTEEDFTRQSVLRVTCLNPKFGLRTQLLLAFGSVSAFIVVLVLIASMTIVWHSGENLKSVNEASFEGLVSSNKGHYVRYLAESLTHTLIPEHVVRILYESVSDRFAGYPNDGDEFVPFFDIDSRSNKYPVIGVTGSPLPLDWQIDEHVNDENHEEHVQNRWSSYNEPALSTANAFYAMQGMCDPSVTDRSAFTYLENCTEANNDISTGGVVNPSPTNEQIYRKSSSLSPILKAVFENHQDIRELGVYFANSGAGAGLNFPHYLARSHVSYTSIGCEWMNSPNPYDPSRPIGKKEEIARCRPEGTVVSGRLFNNLERNWCRKQALNPFEVVVDGPIVSAWNEGQLLMITGRAVYDRITNQFIGCTYIALNLDKMSQTLFESKVTEHSEVSVARFEDGTTVASTAWNISATPDTVKIYDLDVGLTLDWFGELKTLVDYNKIWDPTRVRKKYEAFTLRNNGFLVTTYPIPPVPASYDPKYKPLFFAMLSASQEDIFQVVEDVKETVNEHMTDITCMSLTVGAIGIAIVLLIIYLMSGAITAPLEYMNAAADEIINHFGSTSSSEKQTEIMNPTPHNYCSPKTELDALVNEFNQMVTSFEFTSTSKSVKDEREEIRNGFKTEKDYLDLYRSRKDVNFGYKCGRTDSDTADISQFIHLGSNINKDALSKAQDAVMRSHKHDKRALTSRLFFWTVILIGGPLLLTTIAISGTVMYNISKQFHSSIEVAKSFYLEIKSNALSVRADVVSSRMSRPTTDLYLMTRYTSWLLFGALERTASFTQVKTGVEQCKKFFDITDCPFYQENNFCDCTLNECDPTCTYSTSRTRHRQDLYFICEASDTSSNGDRNSTSFPNVSYSPESTVWWDDVRTLPGSKKWVLASGYETTYDRLRVISASPVHQVVHNSDLQKEYTLANSVAFEADGLFMGLGDLKLVSEAARWSSSDANGASRLRPELCPLGKYGYDPRCRGWYDKGKKLAEADGTPLHVTPPYVHAIDNADILQSATSPLIDPQTKEHVGQVLIDFRPGSILDSVIDKNSQDEAFPFLITTLSGPDSVIGPGFSLLNESAKSISELVLPYDHDCNERACKVRRGQFEKIVASMKGGASGNTKFARKSSADSEETVYMAYAPIVLKGYRPFDSSDFSRGVKPHNVLIYSLALSQTEAALLEPFEQIEEKNKQTIRASIAVLSAIVFLSILFAIYIMSIIILPVINPMLVLLDVIHSINRLDFKEEPPIIHRSNGSRELNRFSDTIQTLYKVTRGGNYAFLCGDLEKAYAVMCDTSQLFHCLDNKNAIGVVGNNIGNLLRVVFRSMDEDDEEPFCGMTRAELIDKGISFYFEAIQLGEEAYDELLEIEGWSPNCLDFMQLLSNRYFNRGMFLLTVKDAHTQPDELEKLGYRDLDIAADLDMEIVEIRSTVGWGHGTNVLKKFDVSLVRAKGHLTLQEMGYPDTWDVEERLHDAFILIRKEFQKNADSSLFQTMTVSGRLQEIETALIRYKLLKGEVRLAAQIGIRMLVEDEYLFSEAQETALEALFLYEAESMDNGKDKRTHRSMTTLIGDEDTRRISTLTENEKILANLPTMKRSVVVDNRLANYSFLSFGKSSLTMEGF